MTAFTIMMITLIGLGLVIGFVEAIIFLIATDKDVTRNHRAE
jgi:hypothetical protein